MNRGEIVDHEIGDDTVPVIVVSVDDNGVASGLAFGLDGTMTPVVIDPNAGKDSEDASAFTDSDRSELARFRAERDARNAAATPRDSEGVQQSESGVKDDADDPGNTGDTRFGTPSQNPTSDSDSSTSQSDKGLE